ncbi:PadR family transcriptional regulator [Stenomitos frigidus]|uniref:PadR family transcriptional regulator n=1 Tax=Stenomitos frigidus ULC18 TaxID=2107698 RepID=A0A2T1ES56_9CYAN|nr:PadR family transcriptional regulator [Stenomitos frigidus]PSB35569.1 PadR family transcriptional regulator [Stenomitos frigidus ULC18]
MFRRFYSHFHAPVWASANLGEPSVQHWFQHGRHDRGKHFVEGLFGFGDEEPRTRRGDIKFLLLQLLAEQPSHGYDLIKQMEVRYGGFRRLSPGSVYPTLQLLEDGGYVTSETREGKRVYTVTDEGRQFLAERAQQSPVGAPWDAFKNAADSKPEAFHQLRQSATELAGAVMQVARSGNTDRMQRVRELLERAKRDIYTLLSEE